VNVSKKAGLPRLRMRLIKVMFNVGDLSATSVICE
jgi:hypothetical protein